ncbi:MAG: hypothetical protein PHQ43_11400 [Dehalococcoidales bacterium]|nr:hypothetical protein [Dehalococcoidales bacterium]
MPRKTGSVRLLFFADLILGLHASVMWSIVFIRNFLGYMVWEERIVWIATAEFYFSILIVLFFLAQIPYWIRMFLKTPTP